MKIQKIKDSLKENRTAILLFFESDDHFEKYYFLKERYQSGQIDDEFKKCFNKFYVLNGAGGMSSPQKEKLFGLLHKRENSLETILRSLYEVHGYRNRRSLFLSFASKLLHTLDDSLPIYDKNIAYMLELRRQMYPSTLDERIKNRISIYEELKTNLSILIKDIWIQNYLKEIREKLVINSNTVSDSKLLDSLLWKLFTITKPTSSPKQISVK